MTGKLAHQISDSYTVFIAAQIVFDCTRVSMDPLYRVLGLPSTAPMSEVKAVYRRLVLELHPDKHPGDKVREELFRAATFAYQTITDPDKAAAYCSGVASSHVSDIIEQEQRRAANSVWNAVLHHLSSDEATMQRALAAQFLRREKSPLSADTTPPTLRDATVDALRSFYDGAASDFMTTWRVHRNVVLRFVVFVACIVVQWLLRRLWPLAPH